MATTNKVKTIGVLTSGGDAPGMNAAIRAAVRRGLQKGVQMKGILKGYDGLMNEEIIDMTARDVSDTIERGGTILYTARCAYFFCKPLYTCTISSRSSASPSFDNTRFACMP